MITEHQIPPLPNQGHLPFWEKEWIAPELKELLFGQTETEDDTNSILLRTYLIIDAHLYTKARGFFDLDLINEISVKCLFKAKAKEDMKTVAPYLIDMTLPDGAWGDKDKVLDFHGKLMAMPGPIPSVFWLGWHAAFPQTQLIK